MIQDQENYWDWLGKLANPPPPPSPPALSFEAWDKIVADWKNKNFKVRILEHRAQPFVSRRYSVERGGAAVRTTQDYYYFPVKTKRDEKDAEEAYTFEIRKFRDKGCGTVRVLGVGGEPSQPITQGFSTEEIKS